MSIDSKDVHKFKRSLNLFKITEIDPLAIGILCEETRGP